MQNDITNTSFFQSLPAHIKEGIMQTGLTFQTEEELRQYVSHLVGPQAD